MDDIPEPEPDELEDKYMDGDNPAADLPMKHPNRNLNKPDIDKPVLQLVTRFLCRFAGRGFLLKVR